MNQDIYRCLDCKWQGTDVDYDTVETCMGDDKTEMCPICGSLNVIRIINND